MQVLIADDDVTSRAVLRATLTKWGHDVVEATTGGDAARMLLEDGAPRLAIVDWMMPELSGPEVCRRLRKASTTALPYIILLTAKSDRTDMVEGLDSGADDFLTKPFEPTELKARLGVGMRLIGLQSQWLELNRDLEQRVSSRTSQVGRLLQYQKDLTLRLGHDFRTPLTPLLALLPLLEEGERDEQRREMLRLALSGARSIRSSVDRVLELCRLQQDATLLNIRRLNLREQVDSALAGLACERQFGNRTLEPSVPSDIEVEADGARLGSLLGYLLDNALRFTAEDGRIEVGGRRAGSSVEVWVADDGLGLAPDQCERVFEPFYKVDAARQVHGTPGLGLTISRAIAERLRGRIWLESPGLGKGACVRFTLPAGIGGSDESEGGR